MATVLQMADPGMNIILNGMYAPKRGRGVLDEKELRPIKEESPAAEIGKEFALHSIDHTGILSTLSAIVDSNRTDDTPEYGMGHEDEPVIDPRMNYSPYAFVPGFH